MRLLATLATPYLLLWLSYAYLTINICLFVCWLLFHIFFCFYHLTLELATAQLDAIAFILIIKYYNIHLENITFALVRRTAFWNHATPHQQCMNGNDRRRRKLNEFEITWKATKTDAHTTNGRGMYIYIYIYTATIVRSRFERLMLMCGSSVAVTNTSSAYDQLKVCDRDEWMTVVLEHSCCLGE